jgi:hypothetical protein
MRPAPVGAATILVVDDHEGARYATARTLRLAGFRIVEAATGAETLRVAAEQPIDLVVLDINLPDIDGFEVCRELRARSQTSDLPVVYLSATFTDVGDHRLGLDAGADSYLTHPVDSTALVATVRALLYAKEAQARRREANARFRAIFDNAPTGMAILDASLHLVEANAALADLLGFDRTAAVRPTLAALAGEGQTALLIELRHAMQEAQPWSAVLAMDSRNGRAELEWRVSPDPGGAQFIALVTDVTQQRQHESRQQRSLASERAARAEAELSNERKDMFLATLSHELRNPLGAIVGWARILKRQPALTPLLAQGVDAIDRNAQVQSRLISDLLDFAGIRFGKMRLQLETVDPDVPTQSAVETVQHQAQQKGIELATVFGNEPVTVVGDPSRLQQVVWNLLTNAVKFTPPGGRITVTTRVEDGTWKVEVADTGAGIEPDFLPRLFERFSQQDASRAKSFAGLGIGLSIVRHLVELHGGSIDVRSAGPGLGATFIVGIPTGETSTGEHKALDPPDLKGVRVLVVEDGDDTRALIARLLTDAGAAVSEAASAEAAVAQIPVSRPQVLISDIGMARTDGYAMMRALRKAGYSAELLPAIALTAFVGEEDREESMAAGFQVHLGKPVDAAALITAVSRLAPDGGGTTAG